MRLRIRVAARFYPWKEEGVFLLPEGAFFPLDASLHESPVARQPVVLQKPGVGVWLGQPREKSFDRPLNRNVVLIFVNPMRPVLGCRVYVGFGAVPPVASCP